MEAHVGKLYLIRIRKTVIWSNLSKANQQRDNLILKEYVTLMITEVRKRIINRIIRLDVMFTYLILHLKINIDKPVGGIKSLNNV